MQNKIIVNMTLKDLNITQDNRYNSLIITPPSNKLNTNLVGLPPFDFFGFFELFGVASGNCPRLVFINF